MKTLVSFALVSVLTLHLSGCGAGSQSQLADVGTAGDDDSTLAAVSAKVEDAMRVLADSSAALGQPDATLGLLEDAPDLSTYATEVGDADASGLLSLADDLDTSAQTLDADVRQGAAPTLALTAVKPAAATPTTTESMAQLTKAVADLQAKLTLILQRLDALAASKPSVKVPAAPAKTPKPAAGGSATDKTTGKDGGATASSNESGGPGTNGSGTSVGVSAGGGTNGSGTSVGVGAGGGTNGSGTSVGVSTTGGGANGSSTSVATSSGGGDAGGGQN